MPESNRNLKPLTQYQKLLLALAILAGCAFALKTLSSMHLTGLWNDELATVEKSFQPSFSALMDQLRNDVHPPLYYVILWGLGKVYGQTATFLRSFSWVSYIIGAGLLGFASWSWSRSGAAVVLALLLALALPFTVTYAVEGKAYAFLYALICAASLFRIRLLARYGQAAYGYSLSWCFAALTHYYGMGLLLCQIVLDLRARRDTVKPLAWALLAPTLWMLINLGYLSGSEGRRWLRPAGSWLLEDTLTRLFGVNWLLIVLVLGVLVWALWHFSQKRGEVPILGLVTDWGLDAGALLFLLTFLVSLVKPSSFPRHYIVLVPSLVGVFSCWVGVKLQDYSYQRSRFAVVAIAMTVILATFWVDSFRWIVPTSQAADRYANDFRTLAMLGSQTQFKFSPQCIKLNLYDHVLRQERLIDPSASWGCLTERDQLPTTLSESVLRAALPGQQQVFLAVTSTDVHGARPIEPYVAELEKRGLQCVPEPRNTKFMKAFHCGVKPIEAISNDQKGNP
ncbi:MAG: hypothetical protein IGS48_13450 [Oscillatoriales cyanobacterium C42_A2020_001]|nr:hypothetical protein [Leptolyngbyaceae cyanobacterium C42_A2020_001]